MHTLTFSINFERIRIVSCPQGNRRLALRGHMSMLDEKRVNFEFYGDILEFFF